MTSETVVELGEDSTGKKEYFVRLVFHSEQASDAAFITGFNILARWSKESGQKNGHVLKISQSRLLKLWVQDRVLAEKMLKKYISNARNDETYEKAKALYENGWYRSAHKLLSMELSEVIPARYVVSSFGKLGRYPIQIVLPDIDDVLQVKLLSYNENECEFSLKSPKEKQACKITFLEFDSRNKWSLSEISHNHYRIIKGNDSVFTNVSSLVLDFDVYDEKPSIEKLQARIYARCLSVKNNSITIDYQDVKAMQYDPKITLEIAENVILSRSQDMHDFPVNAQMPEPFDSVELKLNDENKIIEIKSRYGYEKGIIKSFTPPVLVGNLTNGLIEMESGNRYMFLFDKETGTTCDTVALRGSILNYEFRDLAQAFRCGQEIELTYCPYVIEGGFKRIRTIRQNYNVLLDVNYCDYYDDSWKNTAVMTDKVDVIPHHPEPNYLSQIVLQLLRPTESFTPGSVVYKIDSDKPLKTTVVEFYARSFEDSSAVEFHVSDDNITYVKCGQFDNSWQNSFSQSIDSKTWNFPYQFIEITDNVKGKSRFLLKWYYV
jgi:hypothetical protein